MATCGLNLSTLRNPGVDLGEERWDVDELSYPLCPRKCKQVFLFNI